MVRLSSSLAKDVMKQMVHLQVLFDSEVGALLLARGGGGRGIA
jgi:hypothetical protein